MSYGTIQIEKMTTESGYSLGAGNASSFKNRLINSGMTIDQRNSGASVTGVFGSVYPVDRWAVYGSVANKFTTQQSTTAPAGFINSVIVTSSAATSFASTDEYSVWQKIEGLNLADLDWGTSSAKTITLSFWVRSSLTGTFGGTVTNGAYNRSYVFSYTINAANTWEQKSVTITGDTTGTWLKTNGNGLYLAFDLGSGTSLRTTAGAWTAGYYVAPTGATSVLATNGATFYITGVQFEVGTVATSFDFRSYGTELALCQRYLYCANNVGATSAYSPFFPGVVANSSPNGVVVQFPQQMRTQPSTTYSGSIRFTDMVNWSVAITTLDSSYLNSTGGLLYCSTGSSVISASGGVGRGLYLGADGATARVLFSAEL